MRVFESRGEAGQGYAKARCCRAGIKYSGH